VKFPIVQLNRGELPVLLKVATGTGAAAKTARDRVLYAFLPVAHGMAGEAAHTASRPDLLEDLQQAAALGLAYSLAYCRCWASAEQLGREPSIMWLDCMADWVRGEMTKALGQLSHVERAAPFRHAMRVIDAQASVDSRAREQVALMYADCPDTGPDSLETWAAVHEGITRAELAALGIAA
jgi:hypothetical protein